MNLNLFVVYLRNNDIYCLILIISDHKILFLVGIYYL